MTTENNHDDTVSHFGDSLDRGPTPVALPKIPLVSGDSFETKDGAQHLAESVVITFRSADGTTFEKPLVYRHGGWWRE